MNEPIILRIVGVIAIVGALFTALSTWPVSLDWWQSSWLMFVLGIAAFVRSFLIEQGYVNKH